MIKKFLAIITAKNFTYSFKITGINARPVNGDDAISYKSKSKTDSSFLSIRAVKGINEVALVDIVLMNATTFKKSKQILGNDS